MNKSLFSKTLSNGFFYMNVNLNMPKAYYGSEILQLISSKIYMNCKVFKRKGKGEKKKIDFTTHFK